MVRLDGATLGRYGLPNFEGISVTTIGAMTAALFRQRARRCRLAAFKMQPSAARTALERAAIRWEIMADGASRRVLANDA